MGNINQVPLLRFKEFSDKWKIQQFKNLVKINQGLQISISERLLEQEAGSLFYITNEFLRDNSDKKYFIKNAPETVICNKDDVLMTRTGNTGKVVTDVEGAFHNNFFKISYPEFIDKGFLVNYLKLTTTQNYILRLAGTSTIPDLNHSDFYRINFIFPKLKEQQKIASFLYSVDKKITSLQKKKTLLEEYKKGIMQKIFSQELRFKDDEGNEYPDWKEKTLKTLLKSYRLGGNYSNSDKITEKPLIKMGNLGRGNIKTDKIQYIEDGEVVDSIDIVKEGDLFFNTRNTLELVGKVAIWRNELPLAYYNSNLMKMDFDNNYFMNYRLNSFEGIKGLKRYATGTTSVAAIYTKDLLKLKLNIPSLEEQAKIANFLSVIDDKIQLVNTQIEKTKEFKKGLLQQMFV
ncbi:MAG: restriction endonuclease subunit S [Tenacibaculum sp.]|uniref:restriction endonuclease subunit S n=1 Tax=Tenacibaculum sp. TaxID=1906242 RepID=UPI0017E4E831|nr:restriction endonuclease subunit S [Tenacibaculum sp.]NVK08071.1 restriction endonuclease subunit S [Tenacibaculum sp.]